MEFPFNYKRPRGKRPFNNSGIPKRGTPEFTEWQKANMPELKRARTYKSKHQAQLSK